jgi:hypothetical protein
MEKGKERSFRFFKWKFRGSGMGAYAREWLCKEIQSFTHPKNL